MVLPCCEQFLKEHVTIKDLQHFHCDSTILGKYFRGSWQTAFDISILVKDSQRDVKQQQSINGCTWTPSAIPTAPLVLRWFQLRSTVSSVSFVINTSRSHPAALSSNLLLARYKCLMEEFFYEYNHYIVEVFLHEKCTKWFTIRTLWLGRRCLSSTSKLFLKISLYIISSYRFIQS